jgi:hypothetical protein
MTVSSPGHVDPSLADVDLAVALADGAGRVLRGLRAGVDASEVQRSFIKFNLSSVSGTITAPSCDSTPRTSPARSRPRAAPGS